MKKILLTVLSLISVVLLHAGSLELYFNGNAIPPGDTIQVLGDPSDDIITARVNVKNTSAVAVDVKAKKIIHAGDTLPMTNNYFCWGLCFPPTTYISPNSILIEPGQTVEEFYGDYNPMTVIGISMITYVFFDKFNENDSVAVVVEFNASPAAVADLSRDVELSRAYPNPAKNVVYLDYSLNLNITKATVVISNMLGSQVKEITLHDQSGRIQIPVSELGNGIYFYSLVGNDRIIVTRKFVINR